MNDPRDETADLLLFMYDLRENGVECDIVQVSTSTWAIHGVIPVDGEVLLAEFESYEEAQNLLEQLYAMEAPKRDTYRGRS